MKLVTHGKKVEYGVIFFIVGMLGNSFLKASQPISISFANTAPASSTTSNVQATTTNQPVTISFANTGQAPSTTSNTTQTTSNQPITVTFSNVASALSATNATFLQQLNLIQSQSHWVSEAVTNALTAYKTSAQQQGSTSISQVTFSFTNGGAVNSTVKPSQQQAFNRVGINQSDSAIFTTFFNLLASIDSVPYNVNKIGAPSTGPSYWTLLQNVWNQYKGQSASVIQQAFATTSVPMILYAQVASALTNFIQMRLGMFAGDAYACPCAFYFLNTELSQLDALMGVAPQADIPNFPQTFTAQLPSGASTKVTNSYLAVSAKYQAQRAFSFFNYCLTLFKALTVNYPLMVAFAGDSSTVLGYAPSDPELVTVLSVIDGYYEQAQKGLTFLNKQSPVPTVGSYQSPTLAAQDLAHYSAELHLSCALSVRNGINQMCQSSFATSYQNVLVTGQNADQNNFQAGIQGLLAQANSLYTHAGNDYSVALDAVDAGLYAQISSLIASGASTWQKADASVASHAFSNAVNLYGTAAQMFQQAGFIGLAGVLNHKANAAALGMYQLLLQSYTAYYNNQFSSLLKQMSTAPSAPVTFNQAVAWHTGYPSGLVQFFYYDPGQNPPASAPAFQGIAWLAQNAAPAFSTMLTMYQTDTSTSGQILKSYFVQAIGILQNVSQAAQGMLYNNPLASSVSIPAGSSQQQDNAANANIGALTVEGAVEGRLQHLQIREQFAVADLQSQNNPTESQAARTAFPTLFPIPFPYEGLFQGTPIQSFADLSKVIQLYWSLINVDPAMADVAQYSSYAQELVSAALLLLTDVKTLCNDPDLQKFSSSLATWAQQKQQSILGQSFGGKTPVQLIEAKGDALMALSSPTALDFESAVACYQVAGLLGSSTAKTKFGTALQAQATWYTRSTIPYASVYAAFAYYRAMLATAAGWQVGYNSTAACQQLLTNFSTQLATELKNIAIAVQQPNYTQALSFFADIVALDSEMEFLETRQAYEQLLMGVSGQDFCDRTQQTTTLPTALISEVPYSFQSTQQPIVTYTFPLFGSIVSPQFVEPNLNSAEVSYAQANSLLATLQNQFQLGNYGTNVQTTFTQINQSFSNAAQSFAQANRQDLVTMAQQSLTAATAFSYQSSVVPSQATQNILTQYLASSAQVSSQLIPSQSSGKQGSEIQKGSPVKTSSSYIPSQVTFTFANQPASPKPQQSAQTQVTFSFANASTTTQQQSQLVQPTTVSLVSSAQPDYLLRYSEEDLTFDAQQEQQQSGSQQITKQMQQNAVAVAQKTGATVTTQAPAPTYASILAAAQAALGSATTVSTSPSDLSLITSVVVPLYSKKLSDGGFSDDFVSFDEEITRYQTQVSGLVTGGMIAGAGSRLFAQYSLVSRTMADGKKHIILCSQNSPLQAIPRFQGETQTALFYYSQCSHFYSVNPTTVQIAGATYVQIPDDSKGTQTANALKNVIGTYLAKLTDYQNLVQTIMKMAPPQTTLQNLLNMSFTSYATAYSQLQSAYTWLYTTIGSVSDAQTNSGISWISDQSLNSLYYQTYQNNMAALARFLIGDPTSTSFSTAMNDISSLVTMVNGVATTPAQQAASFQFSGNCFKQAGQMILFQPATIPSTTDASGKLYPNPAPTSLPVTDPAVTQCYTAACNLPAADQYQSPKSYAISWQPYYKSAQYWMQSVTKYSNAYVLTHNGATDAILSDPLTQSAWGMTMLLVMQEVAQQISLFGRNAFSATTTTTAGLSSTSMALSPDFINMVAVGQTGGAAQAQQGFSAITGGALSNTNNIGNIQAQYLIMNKLLLDALIYCSYAMNQTSNLSKQFPSPTLASSSSTSKPSSFIIDPIGSVALLCGLTYYAPGLQMLAGHALQVQVYKGGATQQQITAQGSSIAQFEQAYGDLSIQDLGLPDSEQLMFSKTLPSLINYVMNAIINGSYSAGSTTSGQPQCGQLVNPLSNALADFTTLSDTRRITALNNFISQIFGMIQTMYTLAFLPAQPTAAQQKADSKAEGTWLQNNQNSIAAAMKAEQQNMIINSESYVG